MGKANDLIEAREARGIFRLGPRGNPLKEEGEGGGGMELRNSAGEMCQLCGIRWSRKGEVEDSGPER